jgi:hypothetical protein
MLRPVAAQGGELGGRAAESKARQRTRIGDTDQRLLENLFRHLHAAGLNFTYK